LPRVAAVVAALALSTAGCLRSGFNDAPPGRVHPEWMCSLPATPECPACSTPEPGGRCRDEIYATAHRCDGQRGACAPGGRCVEGFCVDTDNDGNDIDDAFEQEVAERNLPALSLHPDEHCGTPRAIVYRVRRHPDMPARLAVTYVVLYAWDCGDVNGHLGDNEAFGITVDTDAQPGPAGTVGIITVAHRSTACEAVSTCVAQPGTGACAAPGSSRVVVYPSRDKHANYFSLDACSLNCFDTCANAPPAPPTALLDVGGPDMPHSHDLTAEGLVRAEDGWDPLLLHYDPWSGRLFGDAGDVRGQLEQIVAPAGR
jgi:hypothetical protein